LEAIAPNHAFVNELSLDKPGEYTVDLSHLTKTNVAFRYKVHVDETNLARHAPILLKPAWRPQGDKLGLVIEYKLNSTFSTSPITVNNLILLATYEGARAAGCQTKPTGTHLKEKPLVYWRIGDVTLDDTFQKVICRLTGAENGELKPGMIEARWEVSSTAAGFAVGSGLGVSRRDMTSAKGKEKAKSESSDPFADESVAASAPGSSAGNEGWLEVPSLRKLVSGKYDAKQIQAPA
jgi:hypothetical protein